MGSLWRIKMKYILGIIFLFYYLMGSCYPIDGFRKNLVILENTKEFNVTINNNNYIISTDTVKRKDLDAKPYKVFCLNGVRIISGYPLKKNNRFTKVKSIYSDLFEVNNRYIAFKDKDKIIFFNLDNYKFKTLNLKNVKRILSLSDNTFLINYYSNLTKSIDLKIINLETMKSKIIASKFDDIVRNIDFNNNFVLDQYENKKGVKINVSNQFKLPYKSQGSYILDKYLNIISFRYINNATKIEKGFNKVKNSLVHGKYSYYIILLSILFVLLSVFLTKKSVQSFKLPTTLSLFMLFYLVYVYLGATLLNIFYFKYEFNTHLYERKDLLLNIWIYSSIALILIPLGAYFTKILLNSDNRVNFNLFFSKDIDYPLNNRLYYMSIAFLVVSILVLFLYINKVDILPIVGVLQGLDPLELAQLRSNAGNNFDGHLYRYILFYKDIPLLLLLISFFLKDLSKKWKILFFVLFIYNIFIAIMNINKAPLINLFIILLIAYFYYKKRVNWRYIFYFAIVSFILLIIMYILFMGGSKEGILSTMSAPFHRAIIGSISPLFWWQLYIEQHGFLHGLTLPNPHHIFNFEHLKISVAVMDFAHAELRDEGIVGSMPVVFFAEWFANFGWKYAVLSMFIFGIILYLLDYIFIKIMLKRKSAIILALYIYIMFFFKQYNVTSISGIIFDVHLIIPFIIFLLIYLISNKRLAK